MTASTCLVLVRGLPGAGKSTLGGLLSPFVVTADDYMVDDTGAYRFDPSRLTECHMACQKQVSQIIIGRVVGHAVIAAGVVVLGVVVARRDSRVVVVVANTFSQRWEMEPYLDLAVKHGVTVHVVDLFDGGLSDEALAERNVHGVDAGGIASMRAWWEHDWKVGDPRPPWDRG